MKYEIFNKEGKKTGETLLPKEIFGVKVKHDLIYQVATSQMANRRKVMANTKDRGEVRGGGRKPWRQKGLGRARHGSIRSPIWVGGGVAFGPRKSKVFKKKIPKKMRRLALFMVLSSKTKERLIILLDELKIEKPKTKLMAEVLGKLPSKKEKSLVALPSLDKNLILSLRNIPFVATIQAKDLNCLDLLSFKYLIMPVGSVKVIENTFLKKELKKEIKTEKVMKEARKTKKKKNPKKAESIKKKKNQPSPRLRPAKKKNKI